MSLESFKKSQLLNRQSPNLIKLGYDFNANIDQEFFKIRNLLLKKYFSESGSMLTIMKEFSIPSSRTMDILFREFDIDSRTLSESASLSIEKNRSTPFTNLHSFVHLSHNTWDEKQVLLRSSLELKLAKILDKEKICYEVESLRIKYFDIDKQLNRIAIPDFYLPEDNHIIEVKSTYWLDEQNMRYKSSKYKSLGFKFSLYLDEELITNW